MEYRGGTQAWIKTMWDVLSEDHAVALFVHSGRLPGWAQPFDPEAQYDVALINHFPAFRALSNASIGVRIVTSHGVIPAEEWPSWGADAYVSVSESVSRHIPFTSEIIRNPLDLERFRPRSLVSSSVSRVAFVSNRQGDARSIVDEAACLLPEVEFRVVGGETAVDDVEDVYDWADLVIGIARTAVEALACGRDVIAFDYCGFHGRVTKENLAYMYDVNFGGHAQGRWPSAQELANEIAAFNPDARLAEIIRSNHDPRRIAEAYIDLANSVTRVRRLSGVLIRTIPQLTSPRITTVIDKVKRGVRRSSER